jgi:hypothetical protein
MLTPCILLLAVALLGAFDIAYFHWHRADLAHRPESRTEAWIHVARGLVYTLQLAVVPELRFGGAWFIAFAGLYAADVTVAVADVLVEPASRKSLGGLFGGEYLMHIVLSLLIGAYLHALYGATAAWPSLPTAIALSPVGPAWLRVALGGMAAGCFAVSVFEALTLLDTGKVRPVHVSVRLRADVARLWEVTQDPALHPAWDHRFSRIAMGAGRIETGTEMRYERDLAGMTIRGFGRYKLHRPLRQSTFEFWSDDRRSLIRRGVGLWLYRPLPGGLVEFSTSYTYEVRWGLFGRLVDRLIFRPFFQAETERSFRRLAERWFPQGASPVLGASGRKPARFVAAPAVAAVAA